MKEYRVGISGLAYIGLGVSDVEAWAGFAVEVLGLAEVEPREDYRRLLRLDERSWRLALNASEADDVAFLGFEVSSESMLARLRVDLRVAGVQTRWMTPDELSARDVDAGISLTDPDGLPIELVCGHRIARTAFESRHGVRFVTGALGLGHVVVSTSDVDRSRAFYAQLGFELSDFIETELAPDVRVSIPFLHCNERHHTLALLPLETPKRLEHLMVQVSSVDDVIAAYYRASSGQHPIVRHLGRHTNDQMLSFYVATPAGFALEYGCDGIEIRDGWQVRTYDAISLWGHAGRV